METHNATEHLQVIRTLMERSAIYRRALAPISLSLGALGSLGGVLGWRLRIESPRGFVSFWMAVSVIGVVFAYLLVRRQALKDSEPFWSPPTRRVTQALLPALFVGMAAGIVAALRPAWDFIQPGGLPAFWMLFYGCALHAAGFFMTRGIKLFGLLFIAVGTLLMAAHGWAGGPPALAVGHTLMGLVFGGLHLAYGGYLYWTEKGRNAG